MWGFGLATGPWGFGASGSWGFSPGTGPWGLGSEIAVGGYGGENGTVGFGMRWGSRGVCGVREPWGFGCAREMWGY